MMPEANKMHCPHCGAEMNHHADKLVYDSAPDEDETEADACGFILEAHACPNCGHSATRNSSLGARASCPP